VLKRKKVGTRHYNADVRKEIEKSKSKGGCDIDPTSRDSNKDLITNRAVVLLCKVNGIKKKGKEGIQEYLVVCRSQ